MILRKQTMSACFEKQIELLHQLYFDASSVSLKYTLSEGLV